ncbi:hypothetical protein PDIDSM_497 [Penicillium digitatum]|nr:hypothetical protein PDIDSM_497 [Penicillium digitatum]
MSEPSAELESTLRKLSIGGKGPVQDIPRPNVKKFQTAAVTLNHKANSKIHRKLFADSWEDEADLSAPGKTSPRRNVLCPQAETARPPISPNPPVEICFSACEGPPPPGEADCCCRAADCRALGIRAPKRTEQQRAYDRSVKEQEIRRRNREREEKARLREEERMKASIWNN